MGMPHKFYHGRTGIVWSVTPRAVGVEINKQVGNRIMKKRIFVRIEHVQKSKCREHFLKRVKENKKLAAKQSGEAKVSLKRNPGWPRESKLVRSAGTSLENLTPLEYEFTV